MRGRRGRVGCSRQDLAAHGGSAAIWRQVLDARRGTEERSFRFDGRRADRDGGHAGGRHDRGDRSDEQGHGGPGSNLHVWISREGRAPAVRGGRCGGVRDGRPRVGTAPPVDIGVEASRVPTSMLHRMHRWARALPGALALLALTPLLALAAGPPFPDPVEDQAVYDTAGMLSPASIAQIEALIDDMEAEVGAEMVVYTQDVSDISEDQNLENARALVDQWGIGRAGFDDGVVLMIGLDPDPGESRVSLFGGSGFINSYANEERAPGDHRRHVRAARRRRPARGGRSSRRSRRSTRAPRPRSARELEALAADQRGARADRRAARPARNARLGVVEVAPRGRRSRARRLAVDPDGRPAGGDDARAGDRHPPGPSRSAHDQHDPRRARRQRPDQLREPRPRVGGQVRRRPRSADRPGDRASTADGERPPLGAPQERGLGDGPDGSAARTAASAASSLWNVNSALGPVKKALERQAVKIGWLERMPGPSIGAHGRHRRRHRAHRRRDPRSAGIADPDERAGPRRRRRWSSAGSGRSASGRR